jgi:Putative peptidoglycan binding domain
VAFSGNANYAANGGRGSHGTYAFASHSGWSHGREYYWHGHHYGWYGNGWYIIDPFPYGYGYWGPNTGYYYGSGAPVSIEVQTALQQQGYYEGPIDGIVGPGTEAAIAAYQQENGLRVTGTITRGLLVDLGVG